MSKISAIQLAEILSSIDQISYVIKQGNEYKAVLADDPEEGEVIGHSECGGPFIERLG